jgi:Lantibiotic dehydratase, N terminus
MPSALLTGQMAGQAAGPLRWHLVPRFMLRVGGLPFGTAGRLAAPRSAAWAEQVLDAEAVLRDRGAALADALEECVAAHLDDPQARRVLINLRRDVFNSRAPRGLDRAAALLPQAPAAALREWLAVLERRDCLLGTGGVIVAEELADCRDELRTIAETSDLRHGIQLSSPSLDEYLGGYLARPDGRPLSKRERRIERSLLEYLFRTACKTSPFSTLTSVCLGTFESSEVGSERGGTGAVQPLRAVAGGWAKRSATRLNVAVLSRLSALMAAAPHVRGDLPVRATGGLEVHADRVRYLRKQRGNGGNEDAAVTLDAVHERLFYLPTGDVLADVLKVLSDDEPVRFADAVEQLCEMRPGRARADVEEYVSHLLRLGMLVVPDLQLDIHDPDPVAGYQGGLRRIGAPWADDVAGAVARMGACVAEFAGAPLGRRRALLAGIGATVDEAHRILGHDDAPVLRTLVYEDTTLPEVAVTGDQRAWAAHITPGLRQLARVLPAFDGNLVRRLLTKGYFKVRYGAGGRCEDFLSFAHEFGQDIYDNYSRRLMRHQRFDGTTFRPYDNWFRQEEITAVDRARAAVATEIGVRLQETGPDGELVLDDAFVDTVADLLPAPTGSLQPLSFFLQLARQEGGEPLPVVNRVYSGLTLLFSRFAHLFDDGLTADLRASLDAVVPDGAVFAELKGGYDTTNLNLHPVVTPYEIVCPGETSRRPAAEQITIDDLVVEHDAAADRLLLRSRRLGVEVIPVYLGFLLPMALPEVQQVLLTFSYTSMAQLDLWAGTAAGGGEDVVLPRVRLGNVVLQRRTWRIAPASLPERPAGVGDEQWYLEWRRWKREHGLPRHVFASLGGEHKPQYVDFDSFLSVQLLDTAARGTESTVVLTEMLPGPDELWLRDGDRRYVTELTVELDGTTRSGGTDR